VCRHPLVVKAQIQPAIEECLKYLDGYGIEYKKRTTPLEQYDGVNSPTIGLVDYRHISIMNKLHSTWF
jgi:hypothetical protein